MLGIYFAIRAGVNTGIITIIWRSSMFTSALADYIIYGTSLRYYHWIGLIACLACTVLIGISKIVSTHSEVT